MDNLDWQAAVADVRNAAKYLRHMYAPRCLLGCGSRPTPARPRHASSPTRKRTLHHHCWSPRPHRDDCRLLGLVLQMHRGVEKVGVLGFCMGGALSAAAAVLVEEIDASVVFYGTPKPELAKMAGTSPRLHRLTRACRAHRRTPYSVGRLRANLTLANSRAPVCAALDKPLQAHFGELDGYEHFSDPASAKELELQIRAVPGTREVFRYPGVSHSSSQPADSTLRNEPLRL